MDFQDANLKDVVKIFSIQSGLNFIASEAVQDRKMTLFLDKVPIKEVMDKLFKANNLTYELDKEAKIFIVKDWGKPQIETITKVFYLKYATVSSSSLKEEMVSQITGTVAKLETAKPKIGESSKWKVSDEETGITKAIKKLLTPGIGSVIEDYRTNSLIVTDIPSNMPIIEKTIAALDISVPQVLIDVEMLDVSKDTVDQLGFKFGTDTDTSPLSILAPDVFKRGTMAFIGNIAYRGADAFSTAGVVSFGNLYAQVLDFLRTRTDTKYLARPRILTLNNETAEISITKDEAVQGEPTYGTTTTGATYLTGFTITRATELEGGLTKEGIGIFLRVTPQINLETNEITMVINPKISSISSSSLSTLTTPILDPEIRATKSIVKVRDGETIVLGGLIHHEKNIVIKKLPILGDVPFLGAFFRHKNITKDLERELIVFITPHIIKDTNVEFAQAKKTSLLTKEQITISPYERQVKEELALKQEERKRQIRLEAERKEQEHRAKEELARKQEERKRQIRLEAERKEQQHRAKEELARKQEERKRQIRLEAERKEQEHRAKEEQTKLEKQKREQELARKEREHRAAIDASLNNFDKIK
jgi:type II secretory pathway component GspD/PulD (secretin)